MPGRYRFGTTREAAARGWGDPDWLTPIHWSNSLLPNLFKPKASFDLLRLGKDNDGGYQVERNSVLVARSLVSFGISTDWSFEKCFLANRKIPIDSYDHTITDKFWKKFIVTSFLGLFLAETNIKKFAQTLFLYKDYRSFFTGKCKHYREKIGLESMGATSILTTLARQSANTPIFLKIDIEGSEYRILDSLIEHADMICGIVIELHNLDLHLERIVSFVENFPLTLVHIHPNNFGGVDNNGDPLVVELTFAKDPDSIEPNNHLPHRLDQENNPHAKEIQLTFSDNL
jgi:hypothetical protein